MRPGTKVCRRGQGGTGKGLCDAGQGRHYRTGAIRTFGVKILSVRPDAPAKSSHPQGGCMTARKLQDGLAYPPRERAAAYFLICHAWKFLELVAADRLPKPKVIDGIRAWDRLALDAAFNGFPRTWGRWYGARTSKHLRRGTGGANMADAAATPRPFVRR